MKSNKKWALTVLGLTLSVVFILMAINFIVDPLQVYRKAPYAPDFSKEQRYQNPGLARNYDYDTIVIGSSMSENLRPSYLNPKLGVKTLKLSIMGSSAKEQNLTANLALGTNKVKNVIWVVDYFSMRGDPNRVRDEYGAFPFYLYDKNPLNDIKYLLNMDTTKQVIHLGFVAAGLEKRINPDLNTLNTWGEPTAFGKQRVLAEWQKVQQGGPVTASEYEYSNVINNIDVNLISLINKYPKVNFYLYYPPYSILQHRFYYDKNPQLFENELGMKKHVFEKVGLRPNVKIFDFQQEPKVTFNLNNYKDLAHHSPQISQWIIDCIAKGKYRVTKDNLNMGLNTLEKQVETLNEKNL